MPGSELRPQHVSILSMMASTLASVTECSTRNGQDPAFGVRWPRVQIPALPLTLLCNLGQILQIFVPMLSHFCYYYLKNIVYLTGLS